MDFTQIAEAIDANDDGPYSANSVAGAAEAIAALVRYLNNATAHQHTLPYAAAVDDVLASLLPAWDRTLATLLACLDRTLRRIGGVPTYVLTENVPRNICRLLCPPSLCAAPAAARAGSVVTLGVAGRSGCCRLHNDGGHRRPTTRKPSRWSMWPRWRCGTRKSWPPAATTGSRCTPAIRPIPSPRGGAESTVRIAKADLVPTSANLRESYGSFAELRQACQAFCDEVNGREHRETGRAPVEALADERSRLHPVVEQPYAAAFGQTRRVGWESTVSFSGVHYSVPHQLIDERVWVRLDGDEVVIVHLDRSGPVEVARHPRGAKGRPQIQDEHYPTRTTDPTRREPRARSAEDAEFLAIGDGAAQWLEEAAAAGTTRVRSKMGEAISLAKLYGHPALDQALGTAALAGRFGETDLASILTHQRQQRNPGRGGEPTRASEEHSLQSGTAAWARFGKENNE